MLDATGKLPEGALTGNFYALGDYTTCIDINVPEFEWQGSQIDGFRFRVLLSLKSIKKLFQKVII